MKTLVRINLLLASLLLIFGSFHHYSAQVMMMSRMAVDEHTKFLTKSIVSLVRDELLRGNIYLASSKIKFLLSDESMQNIEVTVSNSFGDIVFRYGEATQPDRKIIRPIYFDTMNKDIGYKISVNYKYQKLTSIHLKGLKSYIIFFYILGSGMILFFTIKLSDLFYNRLLVGLNEKKKIQTKIFGLHIKELNSISSTVGLLKQNAIHAAIAQTTQMLAHDVRRPFSMVQSLLSMLGAIKTFDEGKALVNKFAPEVRGAITSVNSMISDIMEVDSDFQLIVEPISPESLIMSSVTELFQYHKKSTINLSYGFKHTHNVLADSLKLTRLLLNIIGNAAQAMNNNGSIWFKTKEIVIKNSKFIEFCVGNSGSFIDEADQKNLFKAFYTKNKKGGTGLGLAIAKKIIESHSGTIRCESSLELGVEFYFTLPMAENKCENVKSKFPNTSEEIYLSTNKNIKPMNNQMDEEVAIELGLIAVLLGQKPLKVLVVDEEAIYRHLVKKMISISPDLSKHITLQFFNDAKGAIADTFTLGPDVILMDIDFDDDKLTGFAVTEVLRKQGVECTICIHSNRGNFEFQEEAIAAGANLFLPKPISRVLFLNLLLSSAKKRNVTHSVGSLASIEAPKKHIIIIEDNILLLESWSVLKEVDQKRYLRPEDFYIAYSKDINILDNAICIITDYYFTEVESEFNGISFANKLRAEGLSIPIYLASDLELSNNERLDSINKQVAKMPFDAWKMITDDMN